MQAGKLPHDLLARLIDNIPNLDHRVIMGPGIGRDAAIIDTGGPSLLIATSDPVTFASDRIGWYAVHVNANDVACLGATPAWFLATILLPVESPEELAESIFNQIRDACNSLDIALVGGHTEVTLGIQQPIVAGTLLGEVSKERLVRPNGAKAGDSLILTKGIAIEGTTVLAREASGRLRSLGVNADTLKAASHYLSDPGISVVAEAQAATSEVKVHAMHDPTEGGLATALHELAEASGLGLLIDRDAIEILPETAAICAAAGLDPVGLLASGALLIAVEESDAATALKAIESKGISARRIGTFVRPETGVIMLGNTKTVVPRFERDEIARFLSGARSPRDG